MLAQQNFQRQYFSAGLIFPIAMASQEMNPLRVVVIASVAALWLFCFSALFSKDKRKARLKYLQKRKLEPGFADRRSSPRISYPMFVLYRVLDAGAQEALAMIMANARDLSQGGILLELNQKFNEGARLELKLALGDRAGAILVRGSVCRQEWLSSLGVYIVAVRLDDGSGDERKMLAQFIEQELKKEEAA